MATRAPSGNMTLDEFFSWDNPEILDHFYNEVGLSQAQIADEVFNGDVSSETIRNRLNQFDLVPDDREPSERDPHAGRKKLLAMNPEDLGLESTPEGDDTWKEHYKEVA